jgi:predicted dehydrogenase
MGMERVSIGILGAQFAARFYMNSLAKLRGVKVDVVAVASKHLDHAEAFAGMYGVPDYYDDYRRLLERTDIDLKEKKKYLVSSWEDVEDWGVMVITFDDRSTATILASDGVLGGVRNTLSVCLSNAVVHVNMNPSNVLEVYAPEPHVFGDEYLVEKLETKAGWNFPSPDEDWVRGYPQEIEDFVGAVLFDREPVSGIELVRDVVESIYAAYWSAEQGRRIELH